MQCFGIFAPFLPRIYEVMTKVTPPRISKCFMNFHSLSDDSFLKYRKTLRIHDRRYLKVNTATIIYKADNDKWEL
jgi:hypothetical protein